MTLGEIRLFPFRYAPVGWSLCDGSMLQVKEYQALYSVIGNTYGGDAKQFALPDLRGATPVHCDLRTRLVTGTNGGQESVTLNVEQMPPHVHGFHASAATATAPSPAGNYLGTKQTVNSPGVQTVVHQIYGEDTSSMVTLDSSVLTASGGGAAHDNMQPSMALNFCICTSRGDYPVRPS